jgi:hypothetical protein
MKSSASGCSIGRAASVPIIWKLRAIADPARNLVLQGEQIAHVTVEPLRPQMRVGLGIDQLSSGLPTQIAQTRRRFLTKGPKTSTRVADFSRAANGGFWAMPLKK